MSGARWYGEVDRRTRVIAVAVPSVLVICAAVIRSVALGDPADIVFDETYYVSDARSQLAFGAEEGFAVHPPLGKWLIAAGMAALGDGPVGWRAAAALAGTLVVLLVYLIGLRLFRRRGAAALAGLLVALDGLLIVQSRIAMLDIFLVAFTTAGAWLLLVHRDRVEAQPAITSTGGRAPPRGPLLLAGVMFGLAVATKWSGLLALGAAGLIVLSWEVARRRRASLPWHAGALRTTASMAVALIVVPAAVYVVTYIPWLNGYAHTHQGAAECQVEGEILDPCPVGVRGRIAGLASHHQAMWSFHRDLEADHPYLSQAAGWPILRRPVVYHWASCPTGEEERCREIAEGDAQEIIALGNPALWWAALLALLPLAVGAARRDGRAGFVLGFWAALYLPWLVPDRPLFIFYMAPVVPFMALGLAYATSGLWRRTRPGEARRRVYPGLVLALVVTVSFIYFHPVWTGVELDEQLIRQRWWFDTWV